MSRKSRTQRERAAAAPAPRPPQRNGVALLAGSLLLLALAVFAAWRVGRPASPPSAPDELTDLSPQQLIARATQLVDGGHAPQALPIYGRLNALSGGTNPGVHCAYGVAIYNALFESDTLGGIGLPVWRTSDERIARINECLVQVDSAIALARTPAERAGFEERRGIMLAAWGFPWEADSCFAAALAHDPGNPAYARSQRDVRAALRDPLHAPWHDPTPR